MFFFPESVFCVVHVAISVGQKRRAKKSRNTQKYNAKKIIRNNIPSGTTHCGRFHPMFKLLWFVFVRGIMIIQLNPSIYFNLPYVVFIKRFMIKTEVRFTFYYSIKVPLKQPFIHHPTMPRPILHSSITSSVIPKFPSPARLVLPLFC